MHDDFWAPHLQATFEELYSFIVHYNRAVTIAQLENECISLSILFTPRINSWPWWNVFLFNSILSQLASYLTDLLSLRLVRAVGARINVKSWYSQWGPCLSLYLSPDSHGYKPSVSTTELSHYLKEFFLGWSYIFAEDGRCQATTSPLKGYKEYKTMQLLLP